MSTVVEVFCEWDIGQEYEIFSSEETAREWLESNPILQEMFEDEDNECKSVEDLIDAGLVTYRERNLS